MQESTRRIAEFSRKSSCKHQRGKLLFKTQETEQRVAEEVAVKTAPSPGEYYSNF